MALIPFKTPSELILEEHSRGPVGEEGAVEEFMFTDVKADVRGGTGDENVRGRILSCPSMMRAKLRSPG